MINKCLYWQLTMTCYDDILCAMLKVAWTTLRCTEHFGSASLPKATERLYLQGGWAVYFPELWRWAVCQLCLTWFLCLLRTLGPEASSPVCFSARTLHQVLNWDFYHAAVAENRHGPAQTVWPGVGWELCTNSQPTCLYYIVLTKSLCLAHTPLFRYSDGETLLVYVFDICTNAPLWKRKWNLDISVIIRLPVFLFIYCLTFKSCW